MGKKPNQILADTYIVSLRLKSALITTACMHDFLLEMFGEIRVDLIARPSFFCQTLKTWVMLWAQNIIGFA